MHEELIKTLDMISETLILRLTPTPTGSKIELVEVSEETYNKLYNIDGERLVAEKYLHGLQAHVCKIMESVCEYDTPDEPRQSQFEKLFNIVDKLAEQCYPILKKTKERN